MPGPFTIRRATITDIEVIAQHRAEMFAEMGLLPASLYTQLVSQTIDFLQRAIPSGEYVGWMAAPAHDPVAVIAGAGVQRRRLLPLPLIADQGTFIANGHQAIVLNVFTAPAWRRQGLAAMLMRHIIEWAKASNIESLVLHASDDGRPLYEKLGFVQTNEMRYARPLC